MVEEVVAAIDPFTGFRVNEVVESKDDTVARFRIWYEFPSGFPEIEPGEFGRTQEPIEPALGHTEPEEMLEETKNI